MSDLPQRLRDWRGDPDEVMSEAADEIERLTALNSALTDKSNSYLVENARLDRELAAANAVIDELLACDDLRTRAGKINPVEPGYEKDILMDEYRRRSRIACNAARALRQKGKGSADPL